LSYGLSSVHDESGREPLRYLQRDVNVM